MINDKLEDRVKNIYFLPCITARILYPAPAASITSYPSFLSMSTSKADSVNDDTARLVFLFLASKFPEDLFDSDKSDSGFNR